MTNQSWGVTFWQRDFGFFKKIKINNRAKMFQSVNKHFFLNFLFFQVTWQNKLFTDDILLFPSVGVISPECINRFCLVQEICIFSLSASKSDEHIVFINSKFGIIPSSCHTICNPCQDAQQYVFKGSHSPGSWFMQFLSSRAAGLKKQSSEDVSLFLHSHSEWFHECGGSHSDEQRNVFRGDVVQSSWLGRLKRR